MITQPNETRIEAFLEEISRQVREILHERSDDILKSWHESIEEAQQGSAESKFPPLKLSLAACVDLERNKIETSLSFTTKYKSSLSRDLPDLDQLSLEL